MALPRDNDKEAGRGKKVRVPFRRNRSDRTRKTDWTKKALEADEHDVDSLRRERIVAKGDLSRQRTVIVKDEEDSPADLNSGVVVAMRGLYADVDDGSRVWPCTVRRVLRTRLINERHPVTIGDRVRFRVESEAEGVAHEGVIEAVEPRHGVLQRRVGHAIHTIVANVDRAIIVSSADHPAPKPHLIDRYMVAAHAGGITPVICMNKIDLDTDGAARAITRRYAALSYEAVEVSAQTGEGIDTLREALRGTECVIAGQSGVGKSSLLNAVQPGLRLKVGDINEQVGKGRHTTTTATLMRLDVGGYVVDTPGIRTFDLSAVPRNEIEMHFVEFADHIPNCKFPDCTHTHEIGCAVKAALERGDILPDRYESYVRMFEDKRTIS